MSEVEKYRDWAAACLRLAKDSSDEGSRQLYLTMAETWRALAEKAEAQSDPEEK